jgi:hypothetical protein
VEFAAEVVAVVVLDEFPQPQTATAVAASMAAGANFIDVMRSLRVVGQSFCFEAMLQNGRVAARAVVAQCF